MYANWAADEPDGEHAYTVANNLYILLQGEICSHFIDQPSTAFVVLALLSDASSI